MDKPFSLACENNRGPILKIIKPLMAEKTAVLEIGSGTGQHAVWFAKHMPQLNWQTSDLERNHAGIKQWLDDYPSPNLLSPIKLDMLDILDSKWPTVDYDCIYSANTAHIMPWEAVVNMLTQAGRRLVSNGLFCLYGPFKYQGIIEAQSNRDFHASLRQRASHMGIREFHQINQVAIDAGLILLDDYAMPANNRLLVWQKP